MSAENDKLSDEVSSGIASGIEKEKDVEKANERKLADTCITWDGPDDLENPRNWPHGRKWAVTFVASFFSFISPLCSSMISPALPAISKDLKINNGVVELLFISIYVLAYAIGPVFLGPLSEIHGRTIILQVSNIVFVAFNTACGGCKTTTQMIIFRFLSGIGGSGPLAVNGGIISDIWTSEERGKAIGIYTLMPLLGPAIGPIVAGFIVQYSDWRWCFYSVSIADVFVQIAGWILLRETYPRVLLSRKAKKLRKETGNDNLRTEWEMLDQSLTKKLRIAFARPVKLITTQPIVQFIAVYAAFLYGLMYLVLSTFPRLWAERYHEPVHIIGLNYISAGLGFLIGAQCGTRLQDRVYKALKHRNNGVGRPEFRVPLMMPSAILVPAGIFTYAWSAQETAFWFWPNFGVFIICANMIVCGQCMQAYIIETYTTYAASALAAATILRSLAGFGFPLFATPLYNTLGYGWGNSVLGLVACVIGWPAVFIFWKYGTWLRSKSPFAAGGN